MSAKENMTIRAAARRLDVKQWEIAEKLGVSEGAFCRMLRRELPEGKQREIMTAISDIAGHDAWGVLEEG